MLPTFQRTPEGFSPVRIRPRGLPLSRRATPSDETRPAGPPLAKGPFHPRRRPGFHPHRTIHTSFLEHFAPA
jgi:hypothetical protein